MRRLAIRLGIALAALLIASQFLLPPYLEHRVANSLTEHGGSANVDLDAFPALRLLFGHGRKLDVTASGLSVDLSPGQEDVFKRLDDFSDVHIDVAGSRAGPFTVRRFTVTRTRDHTYAVVTVGDGTAGDVARYAGSRLGGGFGQALAGLAASALGGFERPIPFDAQMNIVTGAGTPRAENVRGAVAGLPAGPLTQVVANALLNGL
jgi:hypothetical protein